MDKQRLHHFDVIKGIAIFLVVIGHVITFCIRDIDRAPLFKFIGLVHMPLFFFISGYFSYKKDFALPRLVNRFRQLIIPGAIMLILWKLYFPHSGIQSPIDFSCEGILVNEYKNGYWFPYVLFAIILIYSAMTPLLRAIRNNKACIAVTAVICVAIIWSSSLASPRITAILSLTLIADFLIPFMTGVFCARHKEQFESIIANRNIYTISLLTCATSMFFMAYRWDYPALAPVQPYLKPLFHITLPIVAMSIAKQWCDTAFTQTNSSTWGNIWKLLGRESLAIYLIHYFFLFPMPFLQEPLRAMSLGITPTLIIAVPIAAVIVVVTLSVNHLISQSPLLAQLLTGQLNTQKK